MLVCEIKRINQTNKLPKKIDNHREEAVRMEKCLK